MMRAKRSLSTGSVDQLMQALKAGPLQRRLTRCFGSLNSPSPSSCHITFGA